MSKLTWKTRVRYIIWPRITRPFRLVGEFLFGMFTVYRVAFLLVLLAIGIWYYTNVGLDELWPNIIPELLSIALTVFIIDTLNKRHSDDEVKRILIEQVSSKNNAVASEALAEMEARGWLLDGVLRRAFLMSANLDNNTFTGADMKKVNLSFASLKNTKWFEANLEDAFLDHADFQHASFSVHSIGPHFAEAELKNATLSNSDLLGASIRDEQLVQVRSLWRTRMPNGSIYDGRYNLSYDVELFSKHAQDVNNTQEWAFFYGVTVNEYLAGQAWALNHSELFKNQDQRKES